MGFELDDDIRTHYALGVEHDRLGTWGRLEAARTRELLRRYLPASPATVCDVGGAEGGYALPLARAGYRVHLLDAFAPHVELAHVASTAQPDAPLASAQVGDARRLPYPDRSADAVLLLGPLYHLVERAQRLHALVEARRVLRPGGRLFVSAISRFASTVDGIRAGVLDQPVFEGIVISDLRDGVHRNPDPAGHPEWFTLAYFHHPDELTEELGTAGFVQLKVLAVEGVGTLASNVGEVLDDATRSETLLRAIRRVEAEPTLLGLSPHLMGIASAPS